MAEEDTAEAEVLWPMDYCCDGMCVRSECLCDQKFCDE